MKNQMFRRIEHSNSKFQITLFTKKSLTERIVLQHLKENSINWAATNLPFEDPYLDENLDQNLVSKF